MSRSIAPLLCTFLLLAATSASAFNITKILSQYSDYSTFNELLSKSGLATEINKRATITILAVPNGAIGDLTSKSDDVLKRELSTYVVLDYYDIPKLRSMKEKTAKFTNMYQQSGKAAYDQGFLNVTAKDGSFVFGSAVKGAQRDSRLEKSVMNQPYNISILGISQPMVTPGLDGTLAPVSAPPPKATAPSSPESSPPPSDDEAESPEEEEAESPVEETEAPSPSEDADSPASSPSPADDSPPADAQSPPPPAGSSAGKLKVSFGLLVVLASMVAAF
ncbi:PREDICTED: fasciclin-like arabinogalactan protein 3 [Nicotiana attenuata]|uniref:Fasciclin-like arabinogalactan protein 3 n=1 Tax=Nicotiana attenuata TaxID=49451 RepID=A0A314L9B1_NICAT|nr:PREDICTED: fasciclin-like arabinogalactan protein 3 [Nicotiana attenuata]OIT38371.1 fasciclin-like arabinogalactan protein 3 [Nicotiana attenuata]